MRQGSDGPGKRGIARYALFLGPTSASGHASEGPDPDRLAVGGWSYGGILTDYTIASDHRFKAAISGAGSASAIIPASPSRISQIASSSMPTFRWNVTAIPSSFWRLNPSCVSRLSALATRRK